MRNTAILVAFAAATASVSIQAAEPRLRGNLQVQGSYQVPEGGDESRWTVQTPESWLGVEVTESQQNSQYIGVWQLDLEPMSDDRVGVTRQMYLEWRQPLYKLRAGRMATLEEVLLIQPVAVMNGLESGGTFSGEVTQDYLNRVLQAEVSSAEVAFLSWEWQISEETGADVIDQWAVATGLDTPEGKISVLYRDDGGDEGLWGANLIWRDQPWSLGGTYLYREELLKWDLVASYQTDTLVAKFSYGQDEINDVSYWATGLDRPFSQSVRNYSELRWEPDSDHWLWQTGFRMRF